MQKSSFKLYFATLIFTLTLASFSFAGDTHCPIAPPPPDNDPGSELVIANTNPTRGDSYQFLKRFWEILAQGADLF